MDSKSAHVIIILIINNIYIQCILSVSMTSLGLGEGLQNKILKIDVSPFEDRCHDVSTFGDRCVDFRRSMCRPSEMDVLTFEDR